MIKNVNKKEVIYMNKNVAIVTGGSSGLGFEIARCLLQRGINTCIVGRTATKLDEAVSSLSSFNDQTQLLKFQGNVGDEEQVQALFEFLASKQLKVNMIFNAAGVGRFGDPDKITSDMIDTVFEANLIGLILITSYGMREMGVSGGIIVNIMSTAALVGREKEAVYCAAKWGARGFMEAIKVATKGRPVKVIGVYPGGMNTPFWSEDCGLSPNTSKFMDPHDVAERIIDIATADDSSLVTDITINRRG